MHTLVQNSTAPLSEVGLCSVCENLCPGLTGRAFGVTPSSASLLPVFLCGGDIALSEEVRV
jgi:hypothetical protein